MRVAIASSIPPKRTATDGIHGKKEFLADTISLFTSGILTQVKKESLYRIDADPSVQA